MVPLGQEGFLEEEAEELRKREVRVPGGGTRACSTSTPSVLQVRIAKQLTLDRTVDPKDIAILTPYNAQAAEISKGLVRQGVTGVAVCSITKSQGEAGGRPWVGLLGLWVRKVGLTVPLVPRE